LKKRQARKACRFLFSSPSGGQSKYRRLIEQAEKLGVNYTPSKLEVRVK